MRKWRPLIREAEQRWRKAEDAAAYARLSDRPSVPPIRPLDLRVKDKVALIVARTGKKPKSTNDKEGPITRELKEMLHLPIVLLTTPPPSPEKEAGNAPGEPAELDEEDCRDLDDAFLAVTESG